MQCKRKTFFEFHALFCWGSFLFWLFMTFDLIPIGDEFASEQSVSAGVKGKLRR